MGHQQSAPYWNCGPQPGASHFNSFSNILRAGKEQHPTNDEVQKFTVQACISAILCKLIYLSPADLQTALRTNNGQFPGWFQCRSFELSDRENGAGPVFGVFKFTSGTYVVIRGTAVSKDWDANLSQEPKEFLGHNNFVHKGFWTWAKGVPLEMICEQAGAEVGTGETVVTGHSLGGAAAVLAASELMQNTSMRPLVFTFGQPSCFYKQFPPSLQPLKANIKSLMHRFSFDDDPVPTASDRSCQGGFPENLIRLNDSQPYVAHRGDCGLPVPGLSQIQKSAHNIDGHVQALLDAACLAGGALADPKILAEHAFRIQNGIELESLPRYEDGRVLLDVSGTGRNAYIVKASLYDGGGTQRVEGIELVGIQNYVDRSDDAQSEATVVTFTLTFDVTNADLNDNHASVTVFNGFDMAKLTMLFSLNNVLVFGKASHGKSTLIRALKACADKSEDYPRAMPRDNLGVNSVDQSESFTKNRFSVTEAVGMTGDSEMTRDQMQSYLTKKQPRVIIIAWKFGEVLDDNTADFHKLVKRLAIRIHEFNCSAKDKLEMMLVLTHCSEADLDHYKQQYEETAKNLKDMFEMPVGTKHFLVNSADPRDQKRVHGVKELYAYLEEALTTTLPLESAIQLLSVWSRYAAPLANAGILVASGAAAAYGVPGARHVLSGAVITLATGTLRK